MSICFYQSISLTTATEVKTLTSGNDTVDGSTISDSINNDTIVDGSTTDSDVLNASITANATATIASVEQINLSDKFGGSTFTATNVSNGTLTLSSLAGTATTVDGTFSASQNLTMVAGTNIATLTVSDTSGGTNNAATVKLTGGQNLALVNTGSNVEALTLNSTGSANTVTLTGGIGNSVAVTGDKSLVLKAAHGVLTAETITKSLTGGATLTVESNTNNTADLTKIAADKLQFSATAGTGAFTIANNSSLVFTADVAGAAQFGLVAATNGGSQTVTIETQASLTNGVATDKTGTDKHTVVNLSSTKTSAGATTIGNSDFGTATVNITGSKDITFGGTLAAGSVNATDLTGKLALTASANLLTVTGGAGDDTITVATDVAFVVDGKGGSNIIDLTGATATDFSDNVGLSLNNIQFIKINAAATDHTNTFASSQLTGKTLAFVGADDDGATAGGGAGQIADTVTITLDGATADFSGISTNNTTTYNNVDITVNGTTVADNITGSQSADIINGLAGADTINGGNGNDTITGGDGADSMTGGAGSDRFVLGSLTQTGNKVTDFDAGLVTTSVDIIAFDINGSGETGAFTSGALATAIAKTQGATTDAVAATAGAVVATKVTADDNAPTASTSLFIFDDGVEYASASALQAAIQTAGNRTIVQGSDGTVAATNFLAIYDKGSSLGIAVITTAANSTTTEGATVVEIAELTGVSSLANINAADFLFI